MKSKYLKILFAGYNVNKYDITPIDFMGFNIISFSIIYFEIFKIQDNHTSISIRSLYIN